MKFTSIRSHTTNAVSAAAMSMAFLLPATPSHAQTVFAKRPSIPYRLWYSADPDKLDTIHEHTTLVTSGDPRPYEDADKTGLVWCFGTNLHNPDEESAYWAQRYNTTALDFAPNSEYPYTFIGAGPGFDEWTGTSQPWNYQLMPEGMKDGKSVNYNKGIFAAVWVTSSGVPDLYEMKDGRADLFVIEGYSHGSGPGFAASCARLEDLVAQGMERLTIYGFGHIEDGLGWTEAELSGCMAWLREYYPGLHGVGFFNTGANDQQAYDDLVDLCDDLSEEYWPDDMILDGHYSLVSHASNLRFMDASNYGNSNGTDVVIWSSKYPNNMTNQKWRFEHVGNDEYEIFPSYSDTMRLTVYNYGKSPGTPVVLWNSTTNNSRWRLTREKAGYTLSPVHAPSKNLAITSTSRGTQLTIEADADDPMQRWAVTPVVSVYEEVPPFYQAEDAALAGNAFADSYPAGCTGGFWVNFPTTGGTVTFHNVDGGDGGTKTLDFRYALGDTNGRTVNLTVNGSTQAITFPPTISPISNAPSWQQAHPFMIQATLTPGTTNTVTLESTGEDGPNVDKLTIRD